ncbi:MAG: hypothetical protein HYX27_20470 [Acidobacteria bacterium]|nr:hypothetical protein [Acidobacteriota bacterium]
MSANSRRLETAALLALGLLLAAVIYYWEIVQREHARNNNTLGQANIHVPTADLFLWTAFALGIYFGTRFWAAIAPRVFELSAARAEAWRSRLQWVRLLATLVFLGLTLQTISTHVPNFLQKLPLP